MKETSSLRAAATSAIFVPTASTPVTDILAEKLCSKHRDRVIDNAAPPPIRVQRSNLRPPPRILQTPLQEHPRALHKNETPYIQKLIPEILRMIQVRELYDLASFLTIGRSGIYSNIANLTARNDGKVVFLVYVKLFVHILLQKKQLQLFTTSSTTVVCGR